MFKKLKRRLAAIVFGLTVAAIVQELRKPEEEREWHGLVGGVVPYDFRPPTVDRMKAAWWNPNDERLFTDRVFGVGWSVNIPRALELLKERSGN